jgi:ParB family chromosome partitioning protein
MSLVYPREEGRPVIAERVRVLAESLGVLGLRSPITVRACQRVRNGQSADAYEIIAGRHRYEAAVSLKWEEIDAFVMVAEADDAELWEIDENFARAELSEAQKADHHSRRRRILLEKGVVSDKRGPKINSPGKVYSEEAAASLGVSRQSVDKHVWRGNKIAPDVLAEVSGTDLDNGRVLDELAGTPREEQHAKLALIRNARSLVKPAADPLNDPEAHEKQLAALMSAWNRAAGVVREEFLLRIDTPVMERGAA